MKYLINEKYKKVFFVLGLQYILHKTLSWLNYLKNNKILWAIILL